MSYQVLARKWRPKDFSQLMGQEHVVTVLTNALSQQRLHHAYLFTGTRGVGKTTIARIFAKSLNCAEGVSANPCGQCDVCQDIDLGRFVDLLEIDAASRTKVDDTREILDNVQYAPSRGRYKVYLIDEVHMLSKSSFNALLKTLEEPPEHVKFILATTDPQKLPVTVLSRCLQFHLKALTPQQIEQKLVEILEAENVTYDHDALALLAKAARGSMRDSLSLTDQAIAQGQGHIVAANVVQMLGGVDQNWVYKIVIALLKQDSQELLQLSQSIASYAPNYHRLLAELLQLLHQVALWQLVPNGVDVDKQKATLIDKFARAMAPEDIQLYYQIVLNGRKDLAYAGDEQSGFDMVLLRLLAFKPAPANAEAYVDANEDSAQNTSSEQAVSLMGSQISQQESQGNTAVDDHEQPSTSQSEAAVTAQPASGNNETSTSHSSQPADVFNAAKLRASSVEQLQTEQQQLEQLANEQRVSAPSTAQTAAPQAVQTKHPEPQPTAPTDERELQNRTSDIVDNAHAGTEQALDADIEKMLATRNMLRSRRQAVGDAGKKSQQASAKTPSQIATDTALADDSTTTLEQRASLTEQDEPSQPIQQDSSRDDTPTGRKDVQVTQDASMQSQSTNQPQAETTDEQVPLSLRHSSEFNPTDIDPSAIRTADQIDKWANTIEAMGLSGRVRQLAINAELDLSSNEQRLVINLDSQWAHLNSQAVINNISNSYSQLTQQPCEVIINTIESPQATPFVIQQVINDKRLQWAKQIINNDAFVETLKNEFQAFVDENSVMPL
ncbi:DNA polymerase III subunit gamma/tau [Thalassotalea ponticola]|uniref:DNA polymerase III subunit gamma/tau n=1 Tax=Thalassotalea ponticola TaxID=1523392 RepID=UPI0025B38B27|nr:DNA polymerase III subunit gamma/tau [Thalassotalea ponticola]MDN3651373.1 DNA polymerase III subunit gamma/tau [Thalassotalea ponticola]